MVPPTYLADPFQWPFTNLEVRCWMDQPPVTATIATRRLEVIRPHRPCRSGGRSCTCTVSLCRPPTQGLEMTSGRPRHTWLRTVEQDLRPHHLGLWTALQRAQDRVQWRRVVETAVSQEGLATWWWWWRISWTKDSSCSLLCSRLSVVRWHLLLLLFSPLGTQPKLKYLRKMGRLNIIWFLVIRPVLGPKGNLFKNTAADFSVDQTPVQLPSVKTL